MNVIGSGPSTTGHGNDGRAIVGGSGNSLTVCSFCASQPYPPEAGFIGGGSGNVATGQFETLVGGGGNVAAGHYSTVFGGYHNLGML
jgi:hypothetical protein